MKLFLISVLFIASNSYAAGIQKWVDESGMVHYGDTPPVQTHSQTISVSRPPSNPGKPLPRFSGSETTINTNTNNNKPNNTPDKGSKDNNKKICERAKNDLDVIKRSSIIRMKKSDGTEQVLSDEEVDRRRKQLEQDIKQFCK